MIIVDEATRYVWGLRAPLRSKALELFLNWGLQVRAEKPHLALGKLGCDNEFFHEQWISSLGDSGAIILPVSAYTEKAWIAERTIGLVKHITYAQLHHAGAPMADWIYSFDHAITLINARSTSHLPMKISRALAWKLDADFTSVNDQTSTIEKAEVAVQPVWGSAAWSKLFKRPKGDQQWEIAQWLGHKQTLPGMDIVRSFDTGRTYPTRNCIVDNSILPYKNTDFRKQIRALGLRAGDGGDEKIPDEPETLGEHLALQLDDDEKEKLKSKMEEILSPPIATRVAPPTDDKKHEDTIPDIAEGDEAPGEDADHLPPRSRKPSPQAHENLRQEEELRQLKEGTLRKVASHHLQQACEVISNDSPDWDIVLSHFTSSTATQIPIFAIRSKPSELPGAPTINTSSRKLGAPLQDLPNQLPTANTSPLHPSYKKVLIQDPANDTEAFSGPQAREWAKADTAEFDQLLGRGTWELVPPEQVPKGKRVLGTRFVRHVKWQENPDYDVAAIARGEGGVQPADPYIIEKFKSRLVVQGVNQVKGRDYKESFAYNLAADGSRLLSAIAAWYGMLLWTMDLKGFYLCGELDVPTYWRQPKRYEVKGKETWVCKGIKTLYGLPPAGNIAQKKLVDTLIDKAKFRRCSTEPMLFVEHTPDTPPSFVAAGWFTDDSKLVSNSKEKLLKIAAILEANGLSSTINEHPKKFLGVQMEVNPETGTIHHHQEANVLAYIEKARSERAVPRNIPITPTFVKARDAKAEANDYDTHKAYQSLMGDAIWLQAQTRPDISRTVGMLCSYMQASTKADLKAATNLGKYLQQEPRAGLTYHRGVPTLGPTATATLPSTKKISIRFQVSLFSWEFLTTSGTSTSMLR